MPSSPQSLSAHRNGSKDLEITTREISHHMPLITCPLFTVFKPWTSNTANKTQFLWHLLPHRAMFIEDVCELSQCCVSHLTLFESTNKNINHMLDCHQISNSYTVSWNHSKTFNRALKTEAAICRFSWTCVYFSRLNRANGVQNLHGLRMCFCVRACECLLGVKTEALY